MKIRNMKLRNESIDCTLRKEGWVLKGVIPKSELQKTIAEAEEAVAKQEDFLDYQVVPDKIALGNREWIPVKDSYLFYIKPTDNYIKEHSTGITYLRFPSKHIRTGERAYQDY